MDIPDNILNRFQVEKKRRTSERAELIGLITDETNKARKRDKYKGSWTPSYVGKKLAAWKLVPLKDLFYKCYKNEVFDGKAFWGTIKNTKP